MKPTVNYLLAFIFLINLSFMGCSEDDQVGTFNIEQADLLSVDNDKSAYALGEVIWLNIDIPNVLTDIQGNERNIRDLTGAQFALTNIKFFERTGFSLPAHLRLSEEDYIVEKGIMELFPNETLMRTRATLEGEVYRFRFGVKLVEPGNYFISTPSGEGDFETFFDVGNGSDIDFNLKTTIKGGSTNNRFEFTVMDLEVSN